MASFQLFALICVVVLFRGLVQRQNCVRAPALKDGSTTTGAASSTFLQKELGWMLSFSVPLLRTIGFIPMFKATPQFL
ncbi:hypothetical protein GJAV_G00091400 [Gymnothorax javanicus]|nr:hypothetical protein GJAV_G00091400 [Gymnothorax javanicus]